MLSPTGKRVIASEGPGNAKLVLVGESPAVEEMERGRPFVGRAGRVLDKLLNAAGIDRSEVRLVNAVPCRPKGDKFVNHDPRDLAWGRELLRAELDCAIVAGARLIMPLGNNPLSWVAPDLPYPPKWGDEEKKVSEKSRIGAWRGSLFPLGNSMGSVAKYEEAVFNTDRNQAHVLPSYHPAAIARQYSWHPWGIIDFKKAAAFLSGKWEWPKQRKWFINRYDELPRFVDDVLIGKPTDQGLTDGEHLVAIDTEQSPYWIVALVSEDEVHTFEWDERARGPMQRLMASPWVLKCRTQRRSRPHILPS